MTDDAVLPAEPDRLSRGAVPGTNFTVFHAGRLFKNWRDSQDFFFVPSQFRFAIPLAASGFLR
jgi:hypothetical protein